MSFVEVRKEVDIIVRLISEKRIKPAVMITHISLPLTAIADFKTLGETDARFAALAQIVERNNGLWSAEAEEYLLKNWSC